MAEWIEPSTESRFRITSGMHTKSSSFGQRCSVVRNAILTIPLFAAVAACSFGATGAKQANVCTIRSPAEHAAAGGFTAPTQGDIRWIGGGVLYAGDRTLCPYLYSRVWGESGRATTRLVLFSGDHAYLGSYSLTAPRHIRAAGDTLYITTMSGDVDEVRFKTAELPKQIYIDGELVSLFK